MQDKVLLALRRKRLLGIVLDIENVMGQHRRKPSEITKTHVYEFLKNMHRFVMLFL